MNKSVSELCLTAVVSFVVGIVLAALAFKILLWVESNSGSVRRKNQRIEAISFCYRTMYALFEGTYNSEDGSISQKALSTFREYESKLGGRCCVYIGYGSSNFYHMGEVFFPSGDIFEVIIYQDGERFVLRDFTHQDWERLWHRELDMCRIEHEW